jgi:hypothetical protein
LKPEDVRVMGNTVFIDLPDARILDSSLDEDKTSLYDRDRGLFRKSGNDELIEVATATDLLPLMLLPEGRFFLTGYGRRAVPLSAWAS